jgi:hypothetical protein
MFSQKNSSILATVLLTVLVTLWLLPFFHTLGVDDEDYLNVISPTVETARGLRAGVFPLWTSRLGFGIPLPLSNDLSFHPLMPLFGIMPGPWAIRIFYWAHLIAGTLCFFWLGQIMKMNMSTRFVCTLTYLCATPLINYVFTDFWTFGVVMYTLIPCILMSLELLFKASLRAQSRWASLMLAFTVSLFILNGHAGVFLPYSLPIAVYVLSRWRDVRMKWPYFIAVFLIVSLASAAKISALYSEYVRFDPIETPKMVSATGAVDLVSLALGGATSLFKRPLPSARSIFIGLPFLLCFVLGCFRHRTNGKHPSSHALAVFSAIGLLFIPISVYRAITKVISWPFIARDPGIIFGVFLAGLFVQALFKDKRKCFRRTAAVILVLQSLFIILGFAPYWRGLYRSPLIMRDLFKPSPLISAAQKLHQKMPGRILFSPQVYFVSRRALAQDGVELNMLPYFHLWEVNAWLKGVSYGEFYPNRALMVGGIREDNAAITNQALLNIMNIRQVFAFEDEPVASGLVKVHRFPARLDRTLCLYENPSAWPRAYFADPLIQTVRLKRLPQASHNRFMAAEANPVLSLRDDSVSVRILNDGFGRTLLSFDPADHDRCLVLVEYYRSPWRAKLHFKNGKTQEQAVTPAIEYFMSIDVPAGVDRAALSYRPIGQMILTGLTWLIIVVLIIGILWQGVSLKRGVE